MDFALLGGNKNFGTRLGQPTTQMSLSDIVTAFIRFLHKAKGVGDLADDCHSIVVPIAALVFVALEMSNPVHDEFVACLAPIMHKFDTFNNAICSLGLFTDFNGINSAFNYLHLVIFIPVGLFLIYSSIDSMVNYVFLPTTTGRIMAQTINAKALNLFTLSSKADGNQDDMKQAKVFVDRYLTSALLSNNDRKMLFVYIARKLMNLTVDFMVLYYFGYITIASYPRGLNNADKLFQYSSIVHELQVLKTNALCNLKTRLVTKGGEDEQEVIIPCAVPVAKSFNFFMTMFLVLVLVVFLLDLLFFTPRLFLKLFAYIYTDKYTMGTDFLDNVNKEFHHQMIMQTFQDQTKGNTLKTLNRRDVHTSVMKIIRTKQSQYSSHQLSDSSPSLELSPPEEYLSSSPSPSLEIKVEQKVIEEDLPQSQSKNSSKQASELSRNQQQK